mmetsp:Transcript_74168/g.191340  ORF Transcript_74168/g.191340 Transcript_74168/m.191340 type:complete len:308 (+) Transcript_74168:976-1899(+)
MLGPPVHATTVWVAATAAAVALPRVLVGRALRCLNLPRTFDHGRRQAALRAAQPGAFLPAPVVRDVPTLVAGLCPAVRVEPPRGARLFRVAGPRWRVRVREAQFHALMRLLHRGRPQSGRGCGGCAGLLRRLELAEGPLLARERALAENAPATAVGAQAHARTHCGGALVSDHRDALVRVGDLADEGGEGTHEHAHLPLPILAGGEVLLRGCAQLLGGWSLLGRGLLLRSVLAVLTARAGAVLLAPPLLAQAQRAVPVGAPFLQPPGGAALVRRATEVLRPRVLLIASADRPRLVILLMARTGGSIG